MDCQYSLVDKHMKPHDKLLDNLHLIHKFLGMGFHIYTEYKLCSVGNLY